jgi:3-dehydroquinate synthase
MRTLEIKGITGTSRIMVGERLENLKDYIPAEKFVIITDKNVGQIYGKVFPQCEVIQISTGEKIKNIETLQYIYEKLLALEADRSVFIIGIGGGIVCDIAGFIASTYLRGVRFGFVSSTLLAQVDASVGGKNGVNFHGYKNMIGNFNQPEFVICDMNLLKTLPKREVLCGFGEIAKHAFIGDAGMCDFLEENYKKALNLDEEVITRLVYDSAVIKSTIVNRDEREKGERKKLNFGHTFGHAIEKTTDILLHGEAISVGMVVASHLSASKGLLSKQDVGRIETLLAMLELPITLDMNRRKMIDAIKRDKKRQGDDIDFVLLDGIGNAVLEKISIKELEDVVFDL